VALNDLMFWSILASPVVAVFAALPMSRQARARLIEAAQDNDRALAYAGKVATQRYLSAIGYHLAMERVRSLVADARTNALLERARSQAMG
jgi:hypothetical protein